MCDLGKVLGRVCCFFVQTYVEARHLEQLYEMLKMRGLSVKVYSRRKHLYIVQLLFWSFDSHLWLLHINVFFSHMFPLNVCFVVMFHVYTISFYSFSLSPSPESLLVSGHRTSATSHTFTIAILDTPYWLARHVLIFLQFLLCSI